MYSASLVEIVCIALLGGAGLAAAAPSSPRLSNVEKRVNNSPKGVYAHHIVGNAYSYTQDTWKSNIQQAQSYGIDGFALNVGSLDWEPARVADAYAAAEALNSGFKLFMSFDMTSLPCSATGDADLLRTYINDHVNHPNQLYYQNQHVVSTFAGENCLFGQDNFNDGWTYAIRNGAYDTIAFIPAFFVDPGTFGGISVMNGVFNWNGAWPMTDSDISYASDSTWRTDIGDRFYIAGVSPFFFTHYGVDTYNKNFIYRSDDWMYATRWEELIANRDSIDFAEIITWNDYGESHYIGPIGADQPMSQAWVNGFDHTALLPLTQYYASWWKSGTQPSVSKDQVFLWSRPHSKDAQCTSDSVGRPTNADWTDDTLYAVVLSSSSGGSLTLSIGSSSTTQSVSAGVTKISIPLSTGGGPRAVLKDSNGNTLVDFSPGDGYTYTGDSCATYNTNYYVAASP